MQTTEPRLLLEIVEWGKTRSLPLAPLYIRNARDFWGFCRDNEQDAIRFERDADGRVCPIAITGSENDNRNLAITFQLALWNQQNSEPGYVFGPSTGFLLPNGAVRFPDISYVQKERYDALSDEERATFAPLCPDFILELLSPSGSLPQAQSKMAEYRTNGVRLSLLIDRLRRRIEVYRPEQAVQTFDNPTRFSCDPELPGFLFDLSRVL